MKKLRVKELAIEQGMSQEDLAIKSRVKIHTVQRIWQGKSERPYADTLIAIARALGVSIEALYIEEKESYNPEHTLKPSQVAA